MTLSAGQMLINDLDDLRRLLETFYKDISSSGVERTCHFLNYVGTDCTYFQKSMNLFMEQDYERLRDSIFELAELFKIIEGKKSDG